MHRCTREHHFRVVAAVENARFDLVSQRDFLCANFAGRFRPHDGLSGSAERTIGDPKHPRDDGGRSNEKAGFAAGRRLHDAERQRLGDAWAHAGVVLKNRECSIACASPRHGDIQPPRLGFPPIPKLTFAP